MADNLNVTPGTGATVAAEELGGLKYQKIKVVGGETGSTSVMTVNPDGSLKVSVIGALSAAISGGSVFALVQGSVTAIPTGNQSVSGAITHPPGSVSAVRTDNASVIAVVTSSVATVIIGGSVAATFTPPASQSVSGAVTFPPGSVAGVRTDNASVITIATNVGSVIAIIQGSVASAPMGNQSVSGATTAPPGSVTAVRTDNASVITVNQSSSVVAVVTGSVVAIGASPSVIAVPVGSVIAVLQSSSIIGINAGSVIAVVQSSITGTYAEDSGHASADKGLFALAVRNEAMPAITSADLDYSPIAVGSAGELLTANAPLTKWIQGTADLRVVINGNSVVALAAQGTSIFTYVTAVQVANMGSASVLVTIGGGKGSILGYTIAPAGGGSNIYYPNGLKTGENSAITASLSGTASVLVSAQGFIAKI